MKKQQNTVKATLQTFLFALRIAWKHQPSFLFWLLAAGVAKGLLPFLGVLLPKLVLEELTGGKDPARLLALVLIAAGASGALLFLSDALTRRKDRATDAFDRLTDRVMAEKTLALDYPHLEDPRVLTLIQQFKQGRQTQGGLAGAFGWALEQALPACITLAGMLVIVLRMNAWVQASIVLTAALSVLTVAMSTKAQQKWVKGISDVNRIMDYYVTTAMDFANAKDIRLSDGSGMMGSRIHQNFQYVFKDKRMTEPLRVMKRYDVLRVTASRLQWVLIYAALTVQAVKTGLSIADFVMYANAAVSFTTALLSVTLGLVQVYSALLLVNAYTEYMHLPDVLKKGEQPVPQLTDDALVFEDVTFTYPRAEKPVLEHLDLTLKKGEKLAVVGENGAGKTTMIKLMLRLYDPDSGRILLGGKDVSAMSMEEYWQRFSVVFQDYKLFAFSVRENLCIGEGEREKLDGILALLGLDEALRQHERGADTAIYRTFDEDGVEFSGGERQKMAIARALYKDAPIVVMDEPTAALDPIAEEEIYRHMGQLVQQKTAVFISHRLSSCKFCDRVAVFENGRVTQCASHDDLMQQEGLYKRMFEAQAQYYV